MKHNEVLLKDFVTSANLSEVKVIYKTKQRPIIKITTSKEAFDVLYLLYDKGTIEYLEQFYMLLLNRANLVIGWIKLSQGGTSGTVMDIKVIFTLAIKTNALAIILCHNHPSGIIKPSDSDIELTKKIVETGRIIGVNILDHLIISSHSQYFSFADEGFL